MDNKADEQRIPPHLRRLKSQRLISPGVGNQNVVALVLLNKVKPLFRLGQLALHSLPFLVFFATVTMAQDTVSLKNPIWTLTIEPTTLQVTAKVAGGPPATISAAQPEPKQIINLKHTGTNASWDIPTSSVSVSLRLEGDTLEVRFQAGKPGTEFTWPRTADAAIQAWALPLNEGSFVPSNDAKWISHLTGSGPLDTTADLGLPFWGLRYDGFTLSVVLPNPFNNSVQFENVAGRLGANLTHHFTRTQKVKEYSVCYRLGGISAVEAARHYREWLIARGEFVSLKEKIQHTAEVAKLPGAAHIYLWGENTLTAEDLKDWQGFARQLKTQGELTASSPAKRLWSLLSPETKKLVSTIASAAKRPDHYTQSQVTEALNVVLARPDFYDEAGWQSANLDAPERELAKKGLAKLSQAEVCRLNSRLLFAAFPDRLTSPETWGDGFSPKMIRQLADAGFDRLWLGSPSWGGLLKRPEAVELAKKCGFLIAAYDDYNGIHPPGEADTWETSQFDAELYDRGAIVLANGKKMAGYQHKGHMLSPLVTQPYVEERVTRLMGVFHANSWFIDCDGFGQYYDDYSNVHPASQSDDVEARVKRMAWIRDHFGLVIGSEGCSAPVASTIHFAHGVMTPNLGWGDADMKNKQSPYYQGTYYPANEPGKFFNPIPLKENYHLYHFDPRFRLPLFEAVFHDSVVATHHWESGSLKFRDEAKTTQLLELLYGVPPLWHLNPPEFQRRGKEMKRYYDFFSPLHRETATLPLTSFDWLTLDHLVQRTVFGDKIELVANFRTSAFVYQGATIPAESILARRQNTRQTMSYSP